ncbi:MAG: hypothetical protein H0U57_12665 [Tatlockia sp.]|nr:hypothetical protein [Tatlockia sp.]
MNKNFFKTAVIFLITTLCIVGCQQGPAERQGKQLDKKIESVKDKLQNKGPAQKAGEKLDKLTD